MPDQAYLNKKRNSVFHRAFATKAEVENYKAPVLEKPKADLDALCEIYKTSFLT